MESTSARIGPHTCTVQCNLMNQKEGRKRNSKLAYQYLLLSSDVALLFAPFRSSEAFPMFAEPVDESR